MTNESSYKMCTEKTTIKWFGISFVDCHAEEKKNKKLLKFSVLFNVVDNIFPLF